MSQRQRKNRRSILFKISNIYTNESIYMKTIFLYHMFSLFFVMRTNISLLHKNSLFSSSTKRCFSSTSHNLLNGEGVNVISSNENYKIKIIRSLFGLCSIESINFDGESIRKANTRKGKKARDKLGLVPVEGHRLIIDLLKHKKKPEFILMTKKYYNSIQGRDFVQEFCNSCSINTKNVISIVDDKVVKSFDTTQNSQGIFGVFKKSDFLSEISFEASKKSGHILVLDAISDPGNFGTLIRSAFSLGIEHIITIDGCDLYSPKVTRSAMGYNLLLPVSTIKMDESIAYFDRLIKDGYHFCIAAGLDSSRLNAIEKEALSSYKVEDNLMKKVNTIPYYEYDFCTPSMIVIGSEAFGVRWNIYKDFIQLGKVSKTFIPMTRSAESLNAAVAGSILMAHASTPGFMK